MHKPDVTRLHNRDERFMRVALTEAAKGLGQTSPNPAVGAVLVHQDRIVARGHHRGPGSPHAEVDCITGIASELLLKSTLYVTLEPCSTPGRTGPCSDAIIAAGIPAVVVGAVDPNPRHNGFGLVQLRRAGLAVRVGILADECARLNEAFNKWIVTGRPFVLAKCGMTVDGRLTRPPSESQWITSTASRVQARQLRSVVDAVLVGAQTIRVDNPRLTARVRNATGQPLRVVLTRSGRLPRQARIFCDRFAGQTRVYRNQSLERVLADLGRNGITSVLIEGGGEILGQALDRGLIDKVQIYIAPLLSGGPVVAFAGKGAKNSQSAAKLANVRYERVDDDVCLTGYVGKKAAQPLPTGRVE